MNKKFRCCSSVIGEVAYSFKRTKHAKRKTFGACARCCPHLEDVIQFGHSNVYWCFLYDRDIKRYNNNKNYQKNVKTTFAKYVARGLFHKNQLCIATKAVGLDMRKIALIEVYDVLIFPQDVRHTHI